jgi:hypothetical protein
MTKGEENIVLNERDELIQTIEAQQQMIFEANKQIQAQQQEIDRLEVQVEADKDLIRELNNSYINSELNLSALISDKDEQAGRIMELEELAKDLYFAYSNKDADCPHSFETKAVERYHALLGGE